jgi:hypothetical protein
MIDIDALFPPNNALARIFGVRHLSPAAAFHLSAVLDAMKPTAVLVEGPADATDQIKHLIHKDTKPPLAILAYTKQRPVRTILYPLAEYSPEWVALTWGTRNKADTRFIDLPSSVFLEMHHLQKQTEPIPERAAADTKRKPSEHTRAYLDDPWEEIARLSGDPDHETWWERHFEHTLDAESYVRQIAEFGSGLRGIRPSDDDAENQVREAFMRRCIHDVLKKHKPEKVLVVCGAFHASALAVDRAPMDDRQLKTLPSVDCNLTLMPYSYFRLSSQSGYGAGNHAPLYFQRLFEERRAGEPQRLPARFLTDLCHVMRKAGQIRSAAEVIEAVRLANGLAAIHDSPAPTLRDLRDAAVTCLGRGEVDAVSPFLPDVEVGGSIGKLPKGVGKTAIQDDFYLQLESLYLQKYQIDKWQEIELDLREDRTAKSESAAFRDRNRSTFLHRLRALGIEFGEVVERQQQGTSKEKWRLRWRPECEIQLVEAALKGDSVEVATAVRLSERLAECRRVDEAAAIVKEAAVCVLADAMEDARRRLQAMAVEDSGFIAVAKAIDDLSETISYGDVRKVNPEPLKPLVAQLFLRATISVRAACLCDRQSTPDVQKAIVILDRVAGECSDIVDASRWYLELDAIAAADNLNAYLSGLACALVLEKNRLTEDQLAREVGRRLSPGIDAEVGAGWFEGLVQYNRFGLFGRMALWRQLDQYVLSLDDDGFRKALVYLRRAFGRFEPAEIRRVVSNLVSLSDVQADDLKAAVDVKLSDDEAKQLSDVLGDLDL